MGANLGMATAMSMLDRGIAGVTGSHAACQLLQATLQECHRQLVKVRNRCPRALRLTHALVQNPHHELVYM